MAFQERQQPRAMALAATDMRTRSTARHKSLTFSNARKVVRFAEREQSKGTIMGKEPNPDVAAAVQAVIDKGEFWAELVTLAAAATQDHMTPEGKGHLAAVEQLRSRQVAPLDTPAVTAKPETGRGGRS
jgi:hypothetical protein